VRYHPAYTKVRVLKSGRLSKPQKGTTRRGMALTGTDWLLAQHNQKVGYLEYLERRIKLLEAQCTGQKVSSAARDLMVELTLHRSGGG